MSRKLALNKNTLRALSNTELSQVSGGVSTYFGQECTRFTSTVVAATYQGSGCGSTAITITVCRSNCTT